MQSLSQQHCVSQQFAILLSVILWLSFYGSLNASTCSIMPLTLDCGLSWREEILTTDSLQRWHLITVPHSNLMNRSFRLQHPWLPKTILNLHFKQQDSFLFHLLNGQYERKSFLLYIGFRLAWSHFNLRLCSLTVVFKSIPQLIQWFPHE